MRVALEPPCANIESVTRSLKATRAAYDVVAGTYADAFPGTEPEQPLDLAMIAHFASLLGHGALVLDAGCGAGRMLPVLAGYGLSPSGVDVSAEMIRRALADHPQCATQVASLEALPLPDGHVDGFFAWYSFIHTPDGGLSALFAEAARVLTPGGLLLTAFQSGTGAREVGEVSRIHRQP